MKIVIIKYTGFFIFIFNKYKLELFDRNAAIGGGGRWLPSPPIISGLTEEQNCAGSQFWNYFP